jgi:hypothetical protein
MASNLNGAFSIFSTGFVFGSKVPSERTRDASLHFRSRYSGTEMFGRPVLSFATGGLTGSPLMVVANLQESSQPRTNHQGARRVDEHPRTQSIGRRPQRFSGGTRPTRLEQLGPRGGRPRGVHAVTFYAVGIPTVVAKIADAPVEQQLQPRGHALRERPHGARNGFRDCDRIPRRQLVLLSKAARFPVAWRVQCAVARAENETACDGTESPAFARHDAKGHEKNE